MLIFSKGELTELTEREEINTLGHLPLLHVFTSANLGFFNKKGIATYRCLAVADSHPTVPQENGIRPKLGVRAPPQSKWGQRPKHLGRPPLLSQADQQGAV